MLEHINNVEYYRYFETAILTLLPLAFAIGQGSGIQQPLAIAIIAGLLLQYPLVLLAMPVLVRLTLPKTA